MQARCPHCRQIVQLDEDRRGRPVRCPSCQAGFRAPLQDLEEGLAPAPGATRADQLLLASAVLSGIGLLLTLVAIAMHHSSGVLPVPSELIISLLLLPVLPIALSWWANRKSERMWLVVVTRMLAYLWLVGMAVLLLLRNTGSGG